MRKIISSVLITLLLQWQLSSSVAWADNTNTDESVQSTTGDSDFVKDELTILAHATYGAESLSCTPHEKDDENKDSQAYHKFKSACKNVILSKKGNAGKAKELSEELSKVVSDEEMKKLCPDNSDCQYTTIETAADLSLTASELMNENSGIMEKANADFSKVLELAQGELDAKNAEIQEKKAAYDSAKTSLQMAAAAAAISLVYLNTATTVASSSCFACFAAVGIGAKASTVAHVAWYGGILAMYLLTTIYCDNKVEDAKEDGVGKGTEVIISQIESLLKLQKTNFENVSQQSLQVKKVDTLQTIKSFFSTSYDSFFLTADRTLSILVSDAAAYVCPDATSCPTGSALYALAAIAFMAAVAYMLYCIYALLDAAQELEEAYYHTNLNCNGNGGGITSSNTLNKLLPMYAVTMPMLPAQIEKLKNAKSDEEAFWHIANVRRIIQGGIFNVGQTQAEKDFYKKASKTVSFKNQGERIVTRFMEMMLPTIQAATDSELGLKSGTGNYEYYQSQLASAGPMQLAAWPRPEDRVAYLAALVNKSAGAAAGAAAAVAAAGGTNDEMQKLAEEADKKLTGPNSTNIVAQDVGEGDAVKLDESSGDGKKPEPGNVTVVTGNVRNYTGKVGVGKISSAAAQISRKKAALRNNIYDPANGGNAANVEKNRAIKDLNGKSDKKLALSKEAMADANKRASKFKNMFAAAHKKALEAASKVSKLKDFKVAIPRGGTDGEGAGANKKNEDEKSFEFTGIVGGDFGDDGSSGSSSGSGNNFNAQTSTGSLNGNSGALAGNWKNVDELSKHKDRPEEEIQNSEKDLFQIVSRRYLRSAYPVFMLKVR